MTVNLDCCAAISLLHMKRNSSSYARSFNVSFSSKTRRISCRVLINRSHRQGQLIAARRGFVTVGRRAFAQARFASQLFPFATPGRRASSFPPRSSECRGGTSPAAGSQDVPLVRQLRLCSGTVYSSTTTSILVECGRLLAIQCTHVHVHRSYVSAAPGEVSDSHHGVRQRK